MSVGVSILGQTRLPSFITIVDSSDGEATKQIAKQYSAIDDRFEYVHATPGLSHQRNVGIDHSSAEIIHFIDDDVELEPQYFEALVEVFQQDGTGDTPIEVEWLSGGSMSFRREAFQRERFNEDLSLYSGEDLDFTYRLGKHAGLSSLRGHGSTISLHLWVVWRKRRSSFATCSTATDL